MAKRVDQDWYLRQWMERLGKRHADMVSDLPMSPAQASKLMNGIQPYKRDLVIRIADWLDIRPFELLMPPEEAEALRRIRETAAMIVAEDPANFDLESTPATGKKVSGRGA